MIKYVLYEAQLHINNEIIHIDAIQLAKKYGLRRGACRVVKFGRPQDEPINTSEIAYIHLYPQVNEDNYVFIKQNVINV